MLKIKLKKKSVKVKIRKTTLNGKKDMLRDVKVFILFLYQTTSEKEMAIFLEVSH